MSSAFATQHKPEYLIAAEDLRKNPGQWQAYQSQGHCVILAGPGSGKTKTLTIKMARMLAEDVEHPRGIACITYSNECARELERRLDKLGIRKSKNIFIGTMHSFCLTQVIKPFVALTDVGLKPPIDIASKQVQQNAFELALQKAGIDEPPYQVKDRFERYRKGILDRASQEWRTNDPQIATAVEAYEKLLRQQNCIDFMDMPLLGLRLIERYSWIRNALNAKFPILVVDEYQDLGEVLHRLVLALCFNAGIRLIAVGDADQSIYGFAGAKPELLKELAELENVEKVSLRFNYRCGKTIITASEVALGEIRNYEAKKTHLGTIDFSPCLQGFHEQMQLICQQIIPQALANTPERKLGDIAILYQDRYVGNDVAEAVEAADYKYIRNDQGATYPKTPLTRWLEDCAAWCAGGWKSATPRLNSILTNGMNLLDSCLNDIELQSLKSRLVQFLYAHRSETENLCTWLAAFESLILKEIFLKDGSLTEEQEEFEKLKGLCAPAGKLAYFTISLFGSQRGAPEYLNLLTLHSAKGLEFDVVIIPGLEQGKFPHFSARTKAAKREPRRLFYVGLTRARHEVYFTYSGFYIDRYNRRFNNGPSEFILELRQSLETELKETL